MAQHGTIIGQEPLIVHTRPVIDMDDEQFYQFCRLNGDLQIERTAEGDIIIRAPEAGSSGRGNTQLTVAFGLWAERDGSGQVFGSSTGFNLPNGATRSPDVAWVRNERLDALTDKQWQRFLPLCPDFVLLAAKRHKKRKEDGRALRSPAGRCQRRSANGPERATVAQSFTPGIDLRGFCRQRW